MNFLPDPTVQRLAKALGQLDTPCPICRMPSMISQPDIPQDPMNSLRSFYCSRCGEYRGNNTSCHPDLWSKITERQIANASGYIREHQGMEIRTVHEVEFLKSLRTPSVAEKGQKLLSQLAKLYPIGGTKINAYYKGADNCIKHFKGITEKSLPSNSELDIVALTTLPFLSVGWAENANEFGFILFDYLRDSVGHVEGKNYERTNIGMAGFTTSSVTITPLGWEFLDAKGLSSSNTGFVAMWFAPEMNQAWQEAFYPAIVEAGYTPLRIDKQEHNNKIDDEIIASIRGSKFVVADFSGDRGGVYYEAGFASGLNIPVIWTVQEDWLDKVHFDTRQYNHIVWKEDDLPALKKALCNRIKATIGQGAINVND